MVGVIVYTFDLFGKDSKVKERPSIWSDVYNSFCSLVGIIIITWLMIDIQKYLSWLRNFYQDREEEGANSRLKLIESENGELIISMPIVMSKSKKLPQYYCFTTGRHSGSFFLKIGAAIFCIGHIIHNAIIFAKNIFAYNDKTINVTYPDGSFDDTHGKI